MTDLTELGVAAIRDGIAKGDFTAVEVAEAFNANVAAAQTASSSQLAANPARHQLACSASFSDGSIRNG